MRVWTVTVAYFPAPHDLDTNDLLDVIGDAVHAVCATEEGAIAIAKELVVRDLHSPELEITKEGDTTIVEAHDGDYEEPSCCCYARVIPFEVRA